MAIELRDILPDGSVAKTGDSVSPGSSVISDDYAMTVKRDPWGDYIGASGMRVKVVDQKRGKDRIEVDGGPIFADFVGNDINRGRFRYPPGTPLVSGASGVIEYGPIELVVDGRRKRVVSVPDESKKSRSSRRR